MPPVHHQNGVVIYRPSLLAFHRGWARMSLVSGGDVWKRLTKFLVRMSHRANSKFGFLPT